MNSQTPSPNRTEWSGYATLTLLVIFLGALAQSLVVPQSLHSFLTSLRKADSEISQKIPPPSEPVPINNRREVCAQWSSQNSDHRYNFICGAENLFDVYEVNDGQLNMIGSGTFSDGNINAQVKSLTKNRRGYWQLKLSADKNTLEGTWRGDDPREFGNLKLRK